MGEFKAEATRVGFLYSLLTIPWTIDISDDVNAQVSAAGGEAIVRAAVLVTGSCDVLNSFLLLNAVPLWPGCVPVTVTGDIVRAKGAARGAAAILEADRHGACSAERATR